MPSGPLTRADLRELRPIVRPRPVTPPDRLWSAEDWERIRYGLEAPTMEDRWVALVEDDRLHLHRSWTGYGMFEADFAAEGTGRRIVGARREGVTEDGADLHGLFLELLIVGPLLKQDARDLWKRFTALGGLSALGRTSSAGHPKR